MSLAAAKAPERHGRLTLIEPRVGKTADGHLVGRWQCDCGKSTDAAMSRVRNGYTQSCGCLAVDVSRAAIKHGRRGAPEYSSWQAMISRCTNENSKDFARYGAAGVTVAKEWRDSFEAFFAHVGPRPPGTTLDRVDTTRGYEPGNVRWATAQEQAENRRSSWVVEIDGQHFRSMEEAARHHCVSVTTIVRWCDGNFDPRRAHQTTSGRRSPRPNCRRWKKYAD